MVRTEKLIESRFDEQVRQKFRHIQEELPTTLAELDRDADRVLSAYLVAADIPFERTVQNGLIRFDIAASARLR